jgi:hypothetical protein
MEATACPHVGAVFVDTLLRPPSPDEAVREFEEIARSQSY